MTRSLRVLLGSLLLGLAALLAGAEEEGANVHIRNVRLLGEAQKQDAVVVTIVVTDGKLEVITRDEIDPEGKLVLDAGNGVLLGKLSIGETAGFLILDEDPRENVEVLLDTKAHTLFAIHEGVILENKLEEITGATDESSRRGWLAYTPPPMALPVSYLDESRWNRWESEYVSGIFIAAVVLDRQRWFSQDQASDLQVGNLAEFDGGEIRGLRFGVVGTLNFERPWVYTLFAATNAFDQGFDTEDDDDFTFFDYRLDIPLPRNLTLSVGKQKEPISLERLVSLTFLPLQERSAVANALMPSRNFGAVVSGTALEQRMTWAGGVFDDALVTSDAFGNSASQLVGRMTGLPFVSQDESNLVHLGFGARYSNSREGFLAATEPEFNQAPDFVDTGFVEADRTMLYDLEVSWRRGPLWVAGEFVHQQIDAPELGDPVVGGYHVTGSWALTGEMRPYNRRNGLIRSLPVARSVDQGGWGAWELGLRWSELDLTDAALDGGEMGILSLGVNWWLSPVFSVGINYRHVTLDRFGLEGESQGLNARVMVSLE